MHIVLTAIHVIVCVLVILIVLVQSGRNGGLSGFVGGGGGDALFSTSTQQSGLRKITLILAIIFMATSLFLPILSSKTSVVGRTQFPQMPQAPVSAPAEAPAAAVPAAPNAN